MVGFPFDDGRPLTFVEQDSQGGYRLVEKEYGFDPVKGVHGYYSPPVSVVVQHKAKYAVVLQKDEDNGDPNWHYTFVAPIDSIGSREREKAIVQRAMSVNDVDKVHYINCTGMDALIDLTKIRRTHKNLIFKRMSWEVPNDSMKEILCKLASILKVDKIPACTDCERNCENCDLRIASSQ